MRGRITRREAADSRLGLPIIGTVKIGMKNARGLPTSVDYFIPGGKYAALFVEAYGERPQTIQVVFPDDDPAKVCNELYEYRDDEGRRVAYGDGEQFMVWDGNRYIECREAEYPNIMQRVAKKYPNKKVREGGDGWDVTLTLLFVCPLIRGIAGVWRFISKGTLSTIPNIRDTFDTIREARDGHVAGVIFDLSVEFAKSQKPNTRSRFPVVSMVPNESAANLRAVADAKKPIQLLE